MASDRIVVYTHLIRKPLKLYESSGFLTSFLGSITILVILPAGLIRITNDVSNH